MKGIERPPSLDDRERRLDVQSLPVERHAVTPRRDAGHTPLEVVRARQDLGTFLQEADEAAPHVAEPDKEEVDEHNVRDRTLSC